MMGTDHLMGVFSGVIDFEYKFNEMHGLNGGIDIFYDNRLRETLRPDRWHQAVHIGYTFSFYQFDMKLQTGTYITRPPEKGSYFLRPARSEEHTSELQSRGHLVCRLLLEKK